MSKGRVCVATDGERKSNGKAILSPQSKESSTKFPAGIRVLVVDDDETCLLWVENLLLTCNFKATTTLSASEAIEMLRRNKDDFDLVITDVQMPEMDGFQLLEIIGLEMDLPVIMMSIYSHQQYVQKGVQHGAVDYLVKPVRLDEIQNVWQHVLRRRKDLLKEKRAEYQAKLSQRGVNRTLADTAFDAGVDTSNKRPRDQQQPDDDDDDDDDDDGGSEDDDDSGRDNEVPKTKKPRVVWNAVLHKKFVAAVNRLGIDKAVPKKILELMDTDTVLTRENIASHLQKYRMFLKKLEAEQNTPEGLGARNSFEAMNYIGGRYPNSIPPDFAPRLGGFLRGPLNVRGISSSELIQSGQSLRNSISTQVKRQPHNGLPSFQNGHSLQEVSSRFEQSQPLAGNGMTHLGGYDHGHGTTGLGLADYSVDPKMLMNGSNTNSSLMASGPSQFFQSCHSHVTRGLSNGGIPGLSNAGFVDHIIGFNDSWKPRVPNLQSPLHRSRQFTQNQLLMNGNTSSGNQQLLSGFPHMPAVGGELSSLGHNATVPPTQRWEYDKTDDYSQDLNSIFEPLNPITAPNSSNRIMGSQPMAQNSLVNNDDNFIGQFDGKASPTTGQQTGIHEHVTLPEGDFIPNTIECMDDIMNSIAVRENNESIFMDGEFNFDAYSPATGL